MKSTKQFLVGDIVEWSGGNICNGKYGVISIGPYGELCVLDNEGAPDMDVAGHEHELTVVGNNIDNANLLKIYVDRTPPKMKVWTCNKFTGYWPVGTAAVMYAETQLSAWKVLNDQLKDNGLAADAKLEDILEFWTDGKYPKVRILSDGAY